MAPVVPARAAWFGDVLFVQRLSPPRGVGGGVGCFVSCHVCQHRQLVIKSYADGPLIIPLIGCKSCNCERLHYT